MVPLVFGGEGVEERLGWFIELDDLEELAAHAAGTLLLCLHILVAVLLQQEVLAVLRLLAGHGLEV